MTTIKQYSETHTAQPYEVATFLNLGRDWSMGTELTDEEVEELEQAEEEHADENACWHTPWKRCGEITIGGEYPVAERTYYGTTMFMWPDACDREGAGICQTNRTVERMFMWLGARDGEVRPTITVGWWSTDNTEDWPAIESYLPRSQWPEGIYAGKRKDAHTNVDPLLVELIEQYRAELAADE